MALVYSQNAMQCGREMRAVRCVQEFLGVSVPYLRGPPFARQDKSCIRVGTAPFLASVERLAAVSPEFGNDMQGGGSRKVIRGRIVPAYVGMSSLRLANRT
jgi:hypothetical protein